MTIAGCSHLGGSGRGGGSGGRLRLYRCRFRRWSVRLRRDPRLLRTILLILRIRFPIAGSDGAAHRDAGIGAHESDIAANLKATWVDAGVDFHEGIDLFLDIGVGRPGGELAFRDVPEIITLF